MDAVNINIEELEHHLRQENCFRIERPPGRFRQRELRIT